MTHVKNPVSGKRRAYRGTTTAAGTALVLFAAVSCGSSDSGDGTSGPIKLGAIVSLGGSSHAFGPTKIDKTVDAYFEDVNAAGGIDGRKIEYSVVDDSGTPNGAAQAARKLVGDGVVALVGGASYASCATNEGYYKQNDISAIEAIGATERCVTSSNITQVNPSPPTEFKLMLKFGSEELNLTRQCVIKTATSLSEAFRKAAPEVEAKTGDKLAFQDYSVPENQTDYTPDLLKAKSAGCQSILIAGGPQQTPAVAQQMQTQGMDDVVLLQMSGSYDTAVGKALAKFKIPMYAGSSFAPSDTSSQDMRDYTDFMAEHDLPVSSFTEGAYLSAKYTVDVLKGMDGPITAETVSKALSDMSPIKNDLAGTPFEFGASNDAIMVGKLENGVWKPVSGTWFTWK
ncbi:ABC transporter substrate-binding protein [Streptomyces sp. NPDC085946]|uniref:ABC transporter substrate-binding protein n=1 Tax=Streptomyces sp. NPDC085946 TaxID=3365744 RepID=UPI0037D9364D